MRNTNSRSRSSGISAETTPNISAETARRSAIHTAVPTAARSTLYPLMEAVRSGGDLENLGGDGKYSKTIVCPDGCVMFRLTAKPLGGENFFRGGFWKEP